MDIVTKEVLRRLTENLPQMIRTDSKMDVDDCLSRRILLNLIDEQLTTALHMVKSDITNYMVQDDLKKSLDCQECGYHKNPTDPGCAICTIKEDQDISEYDLLKKREDDIL